MKKTILLLSLVGVLIITNAQVDCDYNPYQHQREEYIYGGQKLMKERKENNCENIREFTEKTIDNYISNKSFNQKKNALQSLSQIYCSEVNMFIKRTIVNEEEETLRCKMIAFLGSYPDESNISFLLEYSKKHNITKNEKISISQSLCAFGKYNLAAELLDSFCYDENGRINFSCISSYEYAGEINIVKNYYENLFDSLKKENSDLLSVAHKLAEYGNYEKTYPVFLEAIESQLQERACSALFGLAIIGDTKAFEIIKGKTKNENKFISKDANFILTYIEARRREKCKE